MFGLFVCFLFTLSLSLSARVWIFELDSVAHVVHTWRDVCLRLWKYIMNRIRILTKWKANNRNYSKGIKKEHLTNSHFKSIQIDCVLSANSLRFPWCAFDSHQQEKNNYIIRASIGCFYVKTEIVCLMDWNPLHVETHHIDTHHTHTHIKWHEVMPYTNVRQLNFARHMQKFHITPREKKDQL